jgi:hypothetical protein
MTLVTCNPAAEGRESSVAAVSKLESRVLLGGIEMSATGAGRTREATGPIATVDCRRVPRLAGHQETVDG